MAQAKNSLVEQKKQPKFSSLISSDAYKKMILNTLQDKKKAEGFISSITSAVAVNPELANCDGNSIISSALLGETLNLSPSVQMGHYYLIPRNQKGSELKVATFQLGYKGYIQLALRSGQYADLDVIEIREGEYKGRNKLTGKQQFEFIEDDDIREEKEVVGYLAYFELLNGFKKQIYWTVSKMEKHADKYSQAFNLESFRKLKEGKIPQNELWKYSSYWYKDFEGMAFKTLLRQLITKWGIMSVEMQTAFERDDTFEVNGQVNYVDESMIESVEIVPENNVDADNDDDVIAGTTATIDGFDSLDNA